MAPLASSDGDENVAMKQAWIWIAYHLFRAGLVNIEK
jgi:hypothetical protein